MAEIVAYVLLIDGIPTVFTTSEDVTNAHVAAWGFVTAYPGLHFPTRLPASLDLRSGMLQGSSATFDIHDIDGTLPALFANSWDDAEPLNGVSNISPADDPAPGVVWGKYVGTETIGAAGERRRYSCVPGWHVGMWHVGGEQALEAGLGSAPVSDVPVVWAGRRVCLHRIVWDGSSWSDLTDSTTARSTRVWFGTLLGQGDVEGRVWSFQAAGPESWIGGTIGLGYPVEERTIEADAPLNEEADEHVLYGVLLVENLFNAAESGFTYADPYIDSTSLAGATTYEDFVSGMDTFLGGMAADDSTSDTPGISLNDHGVSDLRYLDTPGQVGLGVRWDESVHVITLDSPGSVLKCRINAHEKVWKRLGYDPATQNNTVDALEHPEKYGDFRPDPYSPGRWYGYFWSASPAAMAARDNLEPYVTWNGELNNNNSWRIWPPIYGPGANYFDKDATPQVIRVTGVDDLWLPPSYQLLGDGGGLGLPTDPDDPNSVYNISGVGDVTHSGLVAFTGPYRDETDPDAEVKTITVPAYVAWRQLSDGTVATSGGQPTLVIWGWPDPRKYGMGDISPTIWGSWRVAPEGEKGLTMRPLWTWEYFDGVGGAYRADATVRKIIESTGEDETRMPPSHSLAVPASMVGGIVGDTTNELNLAVPVTGKPVSARDLLKTILAPTGYALGLDGGRFKIFDPYQVEWWGATAIGVEDLAGKPGEPRESIPSQRLRILSPIDLVTFQARQDPVSGKYLDRSTVPQEIRSRDMGVMYRGQTVKHAVDAPHLPDPDVDLPQAETDWNTSRIYQRWEAITSWWGRQHFEVQLEIAASRASSFWPGSLVELTNPWLINPTGGVYGVSGARGFVTSRNFNAKDERCQVTAIIEARTLLLYAPSAKATEYRANTDGEGYRIFVEDDHLGMRSGTDFRDVDGFVEPAWSTVGGNADIEVFSFDGVSWTGGIYGTVSSINSEASNCYITLTGALTGATWLRDQHHIVVLRDAENQSASWPLVVYAPIGNKSGNYTGTTKTKKFRGI